MRLVAMSTYALGWEGGKGGRGECAPAAATSRHQQLKWHEGGQGERASAAAISGQRTCT